MSIFTIVHPTDFSPISDRALNAASMLAREHDAELVVTHVLSHVTEAVADAFAHVPSTSLREEVETGARKALDERRPRSVRRWKGELVEDERIPRGIAHTADRLDADLVVIGSHGRRGGTRLLLGSVAAEVVRRAPCPVWTVPGETRGDPEDSPASILVGLDFSSPSEQAFRHGLVLAERFGAELHLVHVIDDRAWSHPYGIYTEEGIERERRLIEGWCERAMDRLVEAVDRRVPIHAHIRVGRPAPVVVEVVEEAEADLVVLGTEGVTGLDRLLLGSTAERILRTVPCSVLTIARDRKPFAPPDTPGFPETWV